MPLKNDLEREIEHAKRSAEHKAQIDYMVYERDQAEQKRRNAEELADPSASSPMSAIQLGSVFMALIVLGFPAFFPAWFVNVYLWHKVYALFVSGLKLFALNIVSIVVLTVLIWLLLRFLLRYIKKFLNPWRTVFLVIFWAYILGCYAFTAYFIAQKNEFSTTTTIVCTIIATLLGGNFFRKLL